MSTASRRLLPVLRFPRPRTLVRLTVLALVLAVCALVVPDSTVAPTRFELVKVNHDSNVDVDGNSDIVWILAVGSDARPGEDMTHARGDALQLIGIDTKTHTASDIGIPRDSYVDVDGYGENRINTALYYGGPQLMAKEVGELVGIQPDYVFITRFTDFQALIVSIGGIDVRNPRFFNDDIMYPQGFKKGTIHLGGRAALVFGRARHDLPNGDFDRSADQQRDLAGIVRKVHRRARSKGFLADEILDVMKYTATDVPPTDLFRIAHAVAQIDPSKMTGCVVTGSFATIGGADVVLPNKALARNLGDQVRDDAVIHSCPTGAKVR